MAMVEVKGAHRVTSKGRVYWYAWRGGPRIKAAPDTDAFLTELEAHRAARKGGDKTRIAGLCAEWKTTDAWTKDQGHGGMASSTKALWRPWLDKVQTEFGKLHIRAFDKPEVRPIIRKWRNKWKATPRAADTAKQVLSALLSYAVEEGKLGSNPCFGIPNLYSNDRSEIIWTDADIARVAKTAPPQIMQALKLACLTGIRQSDLLKLSWSHVGDLSIEMRTGKSRGRRVVIVPLYQDLRDLLAEIPKRATTILTTSDGVPWKTGFGSSWTKAMAAANEETLHFHDARGAFATKAYLADFKVREIAVMLGWSEDKVERIIARYVNADALMRDKIRRLDEARKNAPKTKSVKPPVKPAIAK